MAKNENILYGAIAVIGTGLCILGGCIARYNHKKDMESMEEYEKYLQEERCRVIELTERMDFLSELAQNTIAAIEAEEKELLDIDDEEES